MRKKEQPKSPHAKPAYGAPNFVLTPKPGPPARRNPRTDLKVGHYKGYGRRPSRLVLKSPRTRVILGSFDTHVDIGVFAEKEVIQ